jgi:hypothetical protein
MPSARLPSWPSARRPRRPPRLTTRRRLPRAKSGDKAEAQERRGDQGGLRAERTRSAADDQTARRRGPEDGDDAAVDGEADAKPKKATRAPKKAEGESSEGRRPRRSPRRRRSPRSPSRGSLVSS